ncbi:MAG: hypothetical protein AAGH65_04645, partial [Pseudomonadota bacterium]
MRILILLLLVPSSLLANTFVVDSIADTSDPGTLRWAIDQHNANPSSINEIVFDSSLAGQTLSVGGPGTSGNLPFIFGSPAGSLRIDGTNAPGMVIDRNGGARLFILSSNGGFELRNLYLTNTRGPFGGSCLISLDSNARVSIDQVTFDSCVSFDNTTGNALGGAIRMDFAPGTTGRLSVTNSHFIGNRAEGLGSLVLGGAIYVEGGAETRIVGSKFEFNSADNLDQGFNQGGA